MKTKRELSIEHRNALVETLKLRFEENMQRHTDVDWLKVKSKLEANPEKLWSLNEMERTGGEPDVIDYDKDTDEYLFCDCSKETPLGRRGVCYDGEALNSRKENKPMNNAIDLVAEIGFEILSEEQYHKLQSFGNFDTKTSSWLKTPDSVRKLGGALFGDFRYGRVFVYHNGAQSYYSVRGFRGMLRV
ncbi:MAG TPA: DUF4256 domain-containing protein [Tenuifilaceae bacterium]|nr:DUF4256 domain-containing protein [Tenuifilaceae bacterium]HOZ15228.1 DUF4256 domain-containing protein [Tenuifilaceae bacterium]HPI45254.1 DUF4256 domain-containing protein [Tenuifilaceae bacterium]HPN22633.1 DUF4256 domain-containing protein [Tenuifilaceae bacterium]HPV56271.1 DUF4256 domain-containing protein [Tenuifilaceae bacterium]